MIARCEARGVVRDASIWLVQHEGICVGDHVMVRGGEVLERMSPKEAEEAWAAIDEMLAAEDRRSGRA